MPTELLGARDDFLLPVRSILIIIFKILHFILGARDYSVGGPAMFVNFCRRSWWYGQECGRVGSKSMGEQGGRPNDPIMQGNERQGRARRGGSITTCR